MYDENKEEPMTLPCSYNETVKALRNCEAHGNGGDCRKECPYVDQDCGACMHDVLLHDAANAIERLQAEVEEWSQKAFIEQSKAIENLKEIEQLKAEVQQLKGECIQILINGDLDEE